MNKISKKNKLIVLIYTIIILLIITLAFSFAFFTYSRVGSTKTSITSGDITFSYIEGTSAGILNAFPVSDSVGAVDTTGEYLFDVNLSSTTGATASYNVSLVDNNDNANNIFTNDKIKYALIKNNMYVAGTSSTNGIKLSEIDGFSENSINGEGIVLNSQEITENQTDSYKLRIWISDDVSYNNTIDEDGTETGIYNSYTYSLKVKVTSNTYNN